MASNNVALEKKKALELIQDSARDYLSAKITLPLGNPNLKKVHTNQFLWTELPDEFSLKNWGVIAEVLGSSWTRYSGYEANRWYVEGVTIDVERKGKAEMTLDLNAFASSTAKYTEDYRSMVKAYQDAQKKTTNTTTTTSKATPTSSAKSTSNATTKKSVINEQWVKKYNIASSIVNQVKKIVTNPNWGDYTKVRAIFKWMDDNLPYEGYSNTKYGAAGTLKRGKGNCCDHAHLFRAMCHCIGIKCNYVHNGCIEHVYNKVYINGKGTIVDTGRDCASWGSHWGSGGCPVEKTSINF